MIADCDHSVPQLSPPPPPPTFTCLVNVAAGSGDDLLVKNLVQVSRSKNFRFDPQSAVQRIVKNLQFSKRISEDAKDTAETECCLLSFYRHIEPVIQVGPSCGLAALAAAGQMFSGQSLDTTRLLTTAVELGYTQHGEMFSADSLMSLAEQVLPTCSCYLLTNSVDHDTKSAQITDTLVHRGAVLVPYDRDANSEPCLKNGHKAHWALLTGVLMEVDWTQEDINNSTNLTYSIDTELPQLLHVSSPGNWRNGTLTPRTTFVYAVHGRSARTCAWRLDDLLTSNEQLISVTPKLEENSSDRFCLREGYILPDGGIVAGLCGKMILLRQKEH